MHFINRRCSRLCTISVSTALCPSNCSLRTICQPLSVVFCNHRRILFTEFFSHTLKFGDVPAWSESFRMKVPMFVWWQRISWNTLRTGLSPELIAARNPLRQLLPPQPNLIFSEALFANITWRGPAVRLKKQGARGFHPVKLDLHQQIRCLSDYTTPFLLNKQNPEHTAEFQAVCSGFYCLDWRS